MHKFVPVVLQWRHVQGRVKSQASHACASHSAPPGWTICHSCLKRLELECRANILQSFTSSVNTTGSCARTWRVVWGDTSEREFVCWGETGGERETRKGGGSQVLTYDPGTRIHGEDRWYVSSSLAWNGMQTSWSLGHWLITTDCATGRQCAQANICLFAYICLFCFEDYDFLLSAG